MIEASARPTAAIFVLLLLVAGCKGDPQSTKAAGDARPRDSKFVEDPAVSAVKIAATHYKPGALNGVGTLSGTIKLAGSAPPEPHATSTDSAACGTGEPRVAVDAKGGLSNTVVWIADVKTGKPLPIEKRAELASDNCAIDPRVQGVVVGTTVNVFNDDKLVHKLSFHRVGEADTLTTMPFYTAGQVVASERIAKSPGVVEVRCEQHPWTRGYVLVFDQPYFAVTDTDGSFSIDSLPPGSYRVMVWHEGLAKPLEQRVQIAAGGSAKLDLSLTLTAALTATLTAAR